MLRLFQRLVCVLATLLVWHGAAFAQQETLDRIDAVYVLSERNNALALSQIRTLGDQLPTTTPYRVQREYLITRIDLEVDSGETEAAKASIAKLLALARAQTNPDDIGQAMAMGFSASLMVWAAQPASAMLKLEEARPFAQRSGDAVALWRHYRVLGGAQLATGKFEPAVESYLKSLQYADQQTRHPKQARLRALNGLSNVYAAMKNHEKTLAVIDEALALATELGSRKMLATLYLNQGGEYAELGRNADYAAANEKALKISRESGLIRVEATILSNMGEGYLRSHNYPQAEQLARQALAKFREIDDRGGVITAQWQCRFCVDRSGQGGARCEGGAYRPHAGPRGWRHG
jgi:tetratricopeptide (TPR) repeat protein